MAFAYTEATNIVVATAGTSGTPLTFADFVTADRAGTATLLVSVTGESGMTLTYAVRPVEALAIKVSIVVTNKSEDGNVYITGTDWKGDAQTENITTNSDATYESTLYWATITQIDCTVAVDGGGDDWGVGGAGDIAVTQPQWGVIWDKGNSQYEINAILNIGNGSTTTYLTSRNEAVVFTKTPVMFAQANAQLGMLTNDYPTDGATWHFMMAGNVADQNYWCPANAWFKMYGSMLILESNEVTTYFTLRVRGNADIRKSTVSGRTLGTYQQRWNFLFYGSSTIISDMVYFTGHYTFTVIFPLAEINDLHLNHQYKGILKYADGVVYATNIRFTDIDNLDVSMTSYQNPTLILINPSATVTSLELLNNANQLKEGYTVNIHVADKDGADLVGVAVLIEDQYGRTVSYEDSGANTAEYLDITETGVDVDDGTKFTAGQYILIEAEWMLIDSIASNTLTVTRSQYNGKPDVHQTAQDIYIAKSIDTDASGDIAEQIIIYKSWLTTSETLTTHSPHIFTLSKAGYETLILEAITVDAPIVWHLELQPLRARVYGRSRRVQAAQFI